MSRFIGQRQIAFQVAALPVTASVAFVNTDLSIPIGASQRMVGSIFCPITLAGAASGAKWQITVPAAGTLYRVAFEIYNGSTNVLATADVIVAAAAFSNALANAADHYMKASFEITNGVTAGDVTLQFAQLVADAGAATVLAGAYMEATLF